MTGDRNESTGSPPDSVDRGLAEAFREVEPAVESNVLRALQARVGSQLGVNLDADANEDDSAGETEDGQQLRDPSGRYQLLGEIGRGGVGVVYKGRDSDLGRDVAMKVLRDEYADRPEVLSRFVEEAQIGGQLQHPGIVPVYELGLQAGERPYFAMKLVKGETLAAQLARRSGAAEDRRRFLGMFEQMCQTMAYAHARRVMHRDLKPANVMIGAFGEVQIVDWGFAKVLPKGGVADEQDSARGASERSVIETVRSKGSGSDSVAGSMLGTPAYMAPEQAAGDVERLDARSDVFGLGAILCEILTGEPPYRAPHSDLVRQAANAELDDAFDRLRKCDADDVLVSLCTECLARARRARPESAAEVAERISEYLTAVEERARQADVRAAEARYKQRTTLITAAAGFVVLVLGASAWIWIDGQAQDRRAAAMQGFATAMSTASGARGEARAAALDMNLWTTARSSAEQLVSLAVSSDVNSSTRSDARQLLAEVQQEFGGAESEVQRLKRDATMLSRLQTLRIPTDENVGVRGWQIGEWSRLDQEYTRAFTEYLGGASVFEQRSEDSLVSMRRGDIEVRLATSLDHWGLVRDALDEWQDVPDPVGTARIRELSTLLDSEDPWRVQLRRLLPEVAREGDRLRTLAQEADLGSLSAAGCRLLSEALWRAEEEDAAVDVLRLGQEVHPQDFDLCFGLANRLDHFGEQRRREALATFRIAHALQPDYTEVLHRQAIVLEKLGRYDEAERIYRRFISLEPTSSHWVRHMGTLFGRRGETAAALETFAHAMEIDPRDAATLRAMADWHVEQGRPDAAIESFRHALEIRPDYVEALANLGIVLSDQGHLEEAAEYYRRAVQVVPRDDRFHFSLGITLARLGNLVEAIECFRSVVELDPRHHGAHNSLGRALREQGKPDEAIEFCRRAIELDSRHYDSHYHLAKALTELGRWEEAARSYRRSLELNPSNAACRSDLGNALVRLGREEEALDCFRRAIELDSQLGWAHHNLGLSLLQMGRRDEGVEILERLLEIDTRDALLLYSAGAHLIAAGRPDPAMELTKRALEINPRDERIHINLRVSLGRQGKLGEAIECFRDSLEVDPDSVPTLHNLGQALQRIGQLEEAALSYRRAIELDPEFAQAYSDLGLTLRAQDKQEEAIEAFRDGREVDPSNAPIQYNLAYTLSLDRRNAEEAIEIFEKARALFGRQDTPFAREWEAHSNARIHELQRLPALEEVLTARRRAESSEEWAAAVREGRKQYRFRETLVLTEQTLRDSPDLVHNADWGAYNAACAAALFAVEDDVSMTATERSRVRELARAWLAMEVARWRSWIAEGGNRAATGRRRMQHSLKDGDFAHVRGEALSDLPESERASWQELWSSIEQESAEREG